LYSVITSEGQLNWLGADNSNENLVIANNIGTENGLTFLDRNPTAPANGMVAYTASDYATGHMVGDIKLATLSDTDDTDVTGSELVTNGTFDTDLTGWSTHLGSSSVVAGKARLDTNSTTDSNFTTSITCVVGETYVLSADAYRVSGNNSFGIVVSTNSGFNFVANHIAIVGSQTNTSEETKVITFVATATTHYIGLQVNGVNSTSVYSLDNVSVRLAEEDRSVNGNGLQVFGTVTKNPVATGADLVAYSGFSASNYLKQPHNDDLSFGTGDFAVMGWAYPQQPSGTAGYLFDRGDSQGHSRVAIYISTSSNSVTFYTANSSGTTAYYQQANGWTNSRWIHFCMVRRGDEVFSYIDGKLVGSFSQPNSLNNDNAPLTIGIRYSYINPFLGKLALIKWSATAPSPEQIAKIYEDEKVLFQENAQATLYGSSDAVTALAYDDSTELLHVGTSAGRSDFQGLRRINNTTTAVGSAISASNGLIADD
jgi:hypothetical protein